MNLSKLWEIVKDREAWHAAVHRVTKSRDTTYWLNDNNVKGRSGKSKVGQREKLSCDASSQRDWRVWQETLEQVLPIGILLVLVWNKQVFMPLLYLAIATAAAAAKSLQSCPTLCDPRDGSSPGSPIPGILQARTLEWVAISFSNVWKWSSFSVEPYDQGLPLGCEQKWCVPLSVYAFKGQV